MKELTWRQLLSIEVGGAICLPVIMIGHQLFQSYGLISSLAAIGIGNLILFLMALCFAEMSYRNKLVTTDNAVHYFGNSGVKLFAFTLLTAKCFWFAIQLDMMAEVLGGAFLIKIGLGGLIIAIALFGLKALTLFSSLSMPILLGTMAYAFYGSFGKEGSRLNEVMTYEGISVAIAAAITAVVDMPTYFSRSRSRRDSRIAVICFILIAVPLIEGLGIYLSYKNPGSTLTETLTASGSIVWGIWIALFLLLAGWTTNNTNLYSAANCLGTLLPKSSMQIRQIAIGSVGVALCVLDIPKHFMLILQLLGVSVVSMGSVILCCYLLQPFSKRLNIIPWLCGTLVGAGSALKWVSISGIALFDASLAAFIITTLMRRYAVYREG